ncbi:MAG: hypothetical protein VX292_08490, partial [Pseudomonadota bacterium]|nr:hypothetical protein [Pseudomonadota bacterium]
YVCLFLDTEHKSAATSHRTPEQERNKHYAPKMEQSNNGLKSEICARAVYRETIYGYITAARRKRPEERGS